MCVRLCVCVCVHISFVIPVRCNCRIWFAEKAKQRCNLQGKWFMHGVCVYISSVIPVRCNCGIWFAEKAKQRFILQGKWFMHGVCVCSYFFRNPGEVQLRDMVCW